VLLKPFIFPVVVGLIAIAFLLFINNIISKRGIINQLAQDVKEEQLKVQSAKAETTRVLKAEVNAGELKDRQRIKDAEFQELVNELNKGNIDSCWLGVLPYGVFR